jgi:hypothetical protein
MPRLRTRGWIRGQARELADEVNSTFVTNDTINAWIDQAYAKLLDLLVSANPDWALKSTDIQTTAGTREYEVPADFYQVRGVDLVLDADHRISLEQFNFQDRNRYASEWPPRRGIDDAAATRYRVIRKGLDGSETRILFEPDPLGRLYRLWYTQAAQDLAASDSAELDGVNGYEEYIIADIAEKIMTKCETDPSGAVRMKAEALARIAEMSRKRDQGRPVQVADTRTQRQRSYY